LSRTINLELLTSHLAELDGLFNRLEMKLLRGTAPAMVKLLKCGAAELTIAGDIGDAWERLDCWPLFTEEFGLAFSAKRQFASRSAIDVDELRQERWLRRVYCELAEEAASLIRSHSLDVDRGHELTPERDLIALIESDLGVAFVPRSSCPRTLKQAPGQRLSLRRGGPPAHSGICGHAEDAACGRLVATHDLV
jgi:DNA-binding transcriptional LysR family regulator